MAHQDGLVDYDAPVSTYIPEFVGGGNCHLDRDVSESLVRAGFALDEVTAEYAEDGPRWLSFTYQGIARST